jgi:hypothetical protein
MYPLRYIYRRADDECGSAAHWRPCLGSSPTDSGNVKKPAAVVPCWVRPWLLPTTVKPDDSRRRADVLPSRVRRMPPPLASNPHRFHEDRSEIAHDIAELARIIGPRRVRRKRRSRGSAERSGGAINTCQVINGKRVQVQRLSPLHHRPLEQNLGSGSVKSTMKASNPMVNDEATKVTK